jgi:hypothetical protein
MAGGNANEWTLLAVLVGAGALLGGAVAHWRRGRDMIVTGAIIGAVAIPLLGAGLIFYSYLAAAVTIMVILGLAAAAVLGG